MNDSGCWWKCIVLWTISWHTMGIWQPRKDHLNVAAHLDIVAANVTQFMTIVHPSSDTDIHQEKAPCHISKLVTEYLMVWQQWFFCVKTACTIIWHQFCIEHLECDWKWDFKSGRAANQYLITGGYHNSRSRSLETYKAGLRPHLLTFKHKFQYDHCSQATLSLVRT